MSQQETGLIFDVLILSRLQQSSSESQRTDVAVIHRGAEARRQNMDQIATGLGLFAAQRFKFEDVNESLARVQFDPSGLVTRGRSLARSKIKGE